MAFSLLRSRSTAAAMPFIQKLRSDLPIISFHSSIHKTPIPKTLIPKDPDTSEVEDAVFDFHRMLRERPPPPTYKVNQLLSFILKSSKNYGYVISLFRKMESRGIFDLVSLNIALQCYGHVKGYDVMSMFGKILKLGFKPSNYTVNSVLRGLSMSDKVDKAEEFYKLCVKSGYEIDHFAQGLMLNCFVKEGRLWSAAAFLAEVHDPDVVMMNTLIDGMCKAYMADDAYKVYVIMTKKHLIHGDSYTFNSLIHGYCLIHEMDKALEVFQMMPSPDMFTFGTLLDGFSTEGRIMEIKIVINMMLKAGFKLDLVGYTSLINAYFIASNVDKAMGIFQSLRKRKVYCDTQLYNVMLKGLCKANLIGEAMELLEEVPRADLVSYSTVIDGCCKNGEIVFARMLFGEMIEKGITPNLFVCTTLVSGLLNMHHVEEALEFLKTLKKKGVELDDYAYGKIVQGLRHNGRHHDAQVFFNEMLLKGFNL